MTIWQVGELLESRCGIHTTTAEDQQEEAPPPLLSPPPPPPVVVVTSQPITTTTQPSIAGTPVALEQEALKKYCHFVSDNSSENIVNQNSWKAQQSSSSSNNDNNSSNNPLVTIVNVLKPGATATALSLHQGGIEVANAYGDGNQSTTNMNNHLVSHVSKSAVLETGLNLSMHQSDNNNFSRQILSSQFENSSTEGSINATSLSLNSSSVQKSRTCDGNSLGDLVFPFSDFTLKKLDTSVNISSSSSPPLHTYLKEEALDAADNTSSVSVSSLQRCSSFVYTTKSLCKECVADHARHIRFLEQLRRLHRRFRREAVKHKTR